MTAPCDHEKQNGLIPSAERLLGLVFTSLIVFFHIVFFVHAGALWRDEVESVNIAGLPDLGVVWERSPFGSFPFFWFCLLRGWCALGFGISDAGIRGLGFVIGLLILAVVWHGARGTRRDVPLFSLSLFGLNSAVIVFGDSIRGYGLGTLVCLLVIGCVRDMLDSPTFRRFVLATIAAVVSVQCQFQNATIVAATCLGGFAVAWEHRSWRRAVLAAGVGFAAAISLIPYVPVIQGASDWNILFRYPITMEWLLQQLYGALAMSGRILPWVWLGAFVFFAALGVRLCRIKDCPAGGQKDRVTYFLVVMLAGSAGILLFYRVLGFVTRPWYYISWMALTACCFDGIFAAASPNGGAQSGSAGFFHNSKKIWRMALAICAVACSILPVWRAVQQRMTNVDFVAASVQESARPGDLVVVSPWFAGITFDRYYRGAAPWITVPPMALVKFHRWDLLKKQMMATDAMRPVLEKMKKTLKRGGRVWWVGELGRATHGNLSLPPAPNGPYGWLDLPYYLVWLSQAEYFLKVHGARVRPVAVEQNGPVSVFENFPLFAAEGWRKD